MNNYKNKDTYQMLRRYEKFLDMWVKSKKTTNTGILNKLSKEAHINQYVTQCDILKDNRSREINLTNTARYARILLDETRQKQDEAQQKGINKTLESDQYNLFLKALPDGVITLKDIIKTGDFFGINRKKIEILIRASKDFNRVGYGQYIKLTQHKQDITMPIETTVDPIQSTCVCTIEQCIDKLKKAGYKIHKPVTTYEEV